MNDFLRRLLDQRKRDDENRCKTMGAKIWLSSFKSVIFVIRLQYDLGGSCNGTLNVNS